MPWLPSVFTGYEVLLGLATNDAQPLQPRNRFRSEQHNSHDNSTNYADCDDGPPERFTAGPAVPCEWCA